MIKQQISVGDLVEYHGSQVLAWGDYVITYVPKGDRGYAMFLDGAYDEMDCPRLYNVHRDSFTVKTANYKV